MPTPRRQALLATLTGVLTGLALLGAVLVVRGLTGTTTPAASAEQSSTAPTSAAPSSQSPDDGPLDADRLAFARKTVTEDDIALEVPADWALDKETTREAWFRDDSETWLLRIDGRSHHKSIEKMLEARERGVRKSKDLEIERRDTGSEQVDWNDDGLAHRTLVYSYTDGDRGRRLVMSRWISLDGGDQTELEITIAGRPEDHTGLTGLLRRVTASLKLTD